ncbi:MAG: TonB-dependent receptor [Caulobacteraceae bacterium]|nr:TonB-dependent receptor [Caulobacteraceae bacterium]
MRVVQRGVLGAAPAAIALLCLASTTSAADPATEVVVTASHFDHPADRPTANTTVLAPTDAPAGASVGDLLATVSDVEVQRPGGAAGVASVFMRGAQPNFTLVMLEGVPLNDPTNTRGGSADVSAFSALGLQRVEIVRGALSAIYGSGALGGAVNLILPAGAARPSGVVTLAGASDSALAAGLTLRGPLAGGAGGSISLGYGDGGDSVAQSSRTNLSLGGKIAPLDGSDRYGLVLRLSRSDAHAFPDDSGGPRLAVLRTTEQSRAEEGLIGGHWRFDLSRLASLELNGAATARSFDDVSPGVAPGVRDPVGVPAGTSHDRYDRQRGQAILRLAPMAGWRALIGVEGQQEHGQSTGDLIYYGMAFPSRFTLNRTTWSGFAETDLDHGPLALDASLRLDAPQRFGTHVSGRVGAAWRLGHGLTLRAAWGESFKAPSFYALGNSLVGNPGLRPETSNAAEAGIVWRGVSGASLEIAYFHARYGQLIDFVSGPPPRLENRSSVLTQGVQVTATAPLGDRATARASATYADTHDQSDGSRLRSLPPWRGTASLDWRFTGKLTGRLGALYVSDRLDSSVPTGDVTLPPYATLGARLTWAATPRLSLEASLENALNRRYEAAIGFPAPRTVGRLSLAQKF